MGHPFDELQLKKRPKKHRNEKKCPLFDEVIVVNAFGHDARGAQWRQARAFFRR